MRRPQHLSTGSLVAGILIAGLLASIAVPQPSHAAEDGLRIVTDATYDVRPADGVVRVTIDATATNTTPDDASGRTYFTGLTFVVQPGAANVRAISGDVTLPLIVRERTDEFTSVDLTYHQSVFFGQVYHYTVSYDLPDAGDAPDRDVRVTPSVVAFPVWAFGSSGVSGSSVSVRIPAGYNVNVEAGPLNATTADAGTTLSAIDLPDPFSFFAYVSADRPGAFVETQASVDIGDGSAPLVVRSWEDDAAWGTRTTELMTRGIPQLIDLIGLPYPVVGRLRVEEAATSRLGEYAGTYNDVTELITVRYDADAIVSLHEAAHIWFNETLLRGRWIGEAWAEWYAVQAADAIGETGDIYELTDTQREHRIPLNDWGAFGVEDLSVEDYAYAATYAVANLIADQTDVDGLQRVWRAVEANEMSYQPAAQRDDARPETGIDASQPDWQRLLDLLDERTDGAYDDIWREWIVNDAEGSLLDRRATARAAFAATVARADGWELPHDLRFAIGAWRFDEVDADLVTAGEVLDQRATIVRRAAALELEPSDALQRAFEGSAGVDAAQAAGSAELATLDALERAAARLADAPSALETIGLLGSDPAAHVAEARTAYEDGGLDTADAALDDAERQRSGADAAGRLRVGIAGATALGIDVLAMAAMAVRRRGRRRARARALAGVGAAQGAPLDGRRSEWPPEPRP
ncbi:MAG: hypothetical protein ABI622_07045 [Chloroflexota bacterium]